MPSAAHALLLSIAESTLSGVSPDRIATALDIEPSELTAIRKTPRYRKLEQQLAERMLDGAAGRLQALAAQAVGFLDKLTRANPKNTTRSGARKHDPHFIREQRIAAGQILALGTQIRSQTAKDKAERALQKQLAKLTEDDGNDE